MNVRIKYESVLSIELLLILLSVIPYKINYKKVSPSEAVLVGEL
jgi:hypothetical protein